MKRFKNVAYLHGHLDTVTPNISCRLR